MMPISIVSIIVTVYKVERYLPKCIDSLLSQSFREIEIILVDDGSPDGSCKICDEFAKKDSRIHVIHKENGGLVSAWKCGLEKAVTDWVIFIDGDDWIEKDHVLKLIEEQRNNNSDVVVTCMKEITRSESRTIEYGVPAGYYSGRKLECDLYPVMINTGGFEKRGIPGSRCSKLIKKKLLIANLDYEYEKATYKEDFNIIYPVLMDAKSLSLICDDNSSYCYRRTEGSMLHGYNAKMLDSARMVHEGVCKAMHDKHLEIFEHQLQSEYISSMVRCYTNELKNPNGLKAALDNIHHITNDKTFQESIRNVNWSTYPKRFKYIIWSLNQENKRFRTLIFVIFWIVKRLLSNSNRVHTL